MTFLRVNQLLVSKRDKVVYNETFPHKINIIRGENGSGKSTVANFIYYSLGGDYTDWLPEARSCDYVICEVTLNDKIITLRREIIDKIMQPMQIFYGSIDTAMKSGIQGWQLFPYRKTEHKESFSQLLFQLLSFPEVTTDNNESLTLNQVLRLLYIDQISPLNTLIKNVDFDSPLIRQALGHLLLGIYDDKLFNEQLDLRNKRRKLAELSKEFNAVRDVYKSSNLSIDLVAIDQEIKESEVTLSKIDEALENRSLITRSNERNEVFKEIKRLREKVDSTSNETSETMRKIDKIDADTLDSQDFINELENQSTALNDSLLTREIFGKLEIGFCPVCLSKLDESSDENSCHLCKKTVDASDHQSRILRIQQELKNQIKESQYLLNKRKELKNELIQQLATLKTRLGQETKELNHYITSSNSSIDRKQDDLLIKKGELNNKIINLLNQKKLVQAFFNLKDRLDGLEKDISTLNEIVTNKESSQRQKMRVAMDKIQHYSLILLKGDGVVEEGFANASRIGIDFYKNQYFVDERNNFSASSLVILKNSIRFGIFFASLDLDFMRFPRFILCDNMEDKGMREERSHNFQKNVVKLAESFQANFQIIFTTSMIDTDLEKGDYTIGDHYSPSDKSLEI